MSSKRGSKAAPAKKRRAGSSLERIMEMLREHDDRIKVLFAAISSLRGASGVVTMLPAITYPAPHPVKRPGINGGAP